MTTFRNSFRKWWQPPRKASERELDRSVTFLELFYDLVYVVLIAQLSHALAAHLSPAYFPDWTYKSRGDSPADRGALIIAGPGVLCL